MSPEQFLAKLAKNGPEPAYLFLGPEAFERTRCRRALLDAVLSPEERENGFTRHDLDRTPLAAAALDDARARNFAVRPAPRDLARGRGSSRPAGCARRGANWAERLWPRICASRRPDAVLVAVDAVPATNLTAKTNLASSG